MAGSRRNGKAAVGLIGLIVVVAAAIMAAAALVTAAGLMVAAACRVFHADFWYVTSLVALIGLTVAAVVIGVRWWHSKRIRHRRAKARAKSPELAAALGIVPPFGPDTPTGGTSTGEGRPESAL